jgi:hypothetical protein
VQGKKTAGRKVIPGIPHVLTEKTVHSSRRHVHGVPTERIFSVGEVDKFKGQGVKSVGGCIAASVRIWSTFLGWPVT